MGGDSDLLLGGVWVLLVDDNEDALEIFGGYLRYVGASVTVARNGAEALSLLAQVRVDAVITDLSMPGIDGLEVAMRLRGYRGEDVRPTPVIAVTAYPLEYDAQRIEDAGFRSYFVKPVDPARVAREVRNVVDYSRSKRGEDASIGSDEPGSQG